ncbi:MAG: substrate-binding domain-containing protein [Thermoguttaceae bacterium]|nr:substrate-binding domain-containing protein [Thermoguttaceae bacterium]
MSGRFLTRPFRVLALLQTSYKAHRDVLRGLARYARLNGSWALHLFEGRDDEAFQADMDLSSFDGALIGATDRYVEPLRRTRIPTIVVDPRRRYRLREESGERYTVVRCDNEAIGRMCAEFLLKKNYLQFGYVPAASRAGWSDAREKSFVSFLTRRGFKTFVYRPEIIDANGEKQTVSLQRWLAEAPKPIGVMAATDARGRQTLDACRDVGLKAPLDVAVVGVDNDALLCESTTPFLSSVATNLEETIFRAAEILDRQMKGETNDGETLYYDPVGVVDRGSTAPVLTDDAVVLNALELMRLNLHRPFGVAEIATKTDVSRRTLELRFQKKLGRSVLDAAREMRLEKAKLLLTETNRSVADVAKLCGFRSENYLATVFRERLGVAPLKYRFENKKSDE